MNSTPPPVPAPRGTVKNSLMLKCGGIVLLVFMLQIPLFMIDSLRSEREGRRNEAVREIGDRWGGRQLLVGPLLVIPYEINVEVWQDRVVEGVRTRVRSTQRQRSQAFLQPEQLSLSGSLVPEQRQRGIYNAIVYAAQLQLKGRFVKPDWRSLAVEPADVFWSEARVIAGISDIRGLREVPAWSWQGKPVSWQPGTRWAELKSGLHSLVPGMGPAVESYDFEMNLLVNGSGDFSCSPLGRASSINLSSAWKDPSFTGAYLPVRREVSESGFKAEWTVSHLGRNLPQQWTDREGYCPPKWSEFSEGAVGVSLEHAVDSYRTMDRALKHGILFLALVFTAFFVFEMSAVPSLSVLHYTLVGAALCLFYLALLSLSEFLGFSWAYLIAASASVLLISLYSVAILRSGYRALVIVAGLVGVYGYLYFVLQMQDYALLAGTAALFVALSAIMWVTRGRRSVEP